MCLTRSITSKTAEAAPKATAKVCSSGRALPREKEPITTAKNTWGAPIRIKHDVMVKLCNDEKKSHGDELDKA